MSKIRVALIEDHDLTRVGIRTALQQRDTIEVVGDAANATDGLKLLQSTKPDVAIVDIGLPDFDGIELTQKFKKSIAESDPNTKVLILTFQDNEEEVLAAFAAGADSYCMKDISFDQLLDVVKVTHEGNSWIDPAIARIVLKQARTKESAPEEQKVEGKRVTIKAAEPEFSHIIVLELIVQGYSNAAIAEKLYITVGTVKTHVRNILNKLCADDRTQAAVLALRSGLVG
jgi:DNA-binding NarL/FixJ family response regulator